MTRISRLLISLTLFLTGAPLPAAETLKVVSWNMEWFPGHRPTASAQDADRHMKEGQAALKRLNPDVFVGVEMHDWAAFHQLVSVVPGLTVHVVSSFKDPETGEIRAQQIGIASKLKCRGAWWESWAANVPDISRGFSFAALERADGGLLMVYGNHLKSNRGSDTEEGAKIVAVMRDEQVKQLLAHKASVETAFAKHPIAGWIMAGDFNTNHDGQFPLDSVVKTMTGAGYFNTWSRVPKEKRLTWRNDREKRFEPTTFDYIFTQGLPETDAVVIEVAGGVSDHTPIGIVIPAR